MLIDEYLEKQAFTLNPRALWHLARHKFGRTAVSKGMEAMGKSEKYLKTRAIRKLDVAKDHAKSLGINVDAPGKRGLLQSVKDHKLAVGAGTLGVGGLGVAIGGRKR